MAMENLSQIHEKINGLKPEKILYISIGIILCSVAASGFLSYSSDIDLVTYLPGISLCPFHVLTGKCCPGCGMTKAFLLLGQLKIMEALKYNLFSLPLLLLMIVYFFSGDVPSWLQNKYLVRMSLIVVISFWLLRLLSPSVYSICLPF